MQVTRVAAGFETRISAFVYYQEGVVGGGVGFLSGFETRISAFVYYQEGVWGGASFSGLWHGRFYLICYRYDASAWRRGFLHSPISYQHIFGIIRCFCLKEGVFTQPYFISACLFKEKIVPTSSSYSITSKNIRKTIPTSSSYSITLWLKRYWTRTNNQPISHINYYFTVFLSSVPCCIGYILVLAWQAAEVAAESPTQASWTATRVLLKGLPC